MRPERKYRFRTFVVLRNFLIRGRFVLKVGYKFSLKFGAVLCTSYAILTVCRCSSGVEQRIRNAWAGSSNLPNGTIERFSQYARCAVINYPTGLGIVLLFVLDTAGKAA